MMDSFPEWCLHKSSNIIWTCNFYGKCHILNYSTVSFYLLKFNYFTILCVQVLILQSTVYGVVLLQSSSLRSLSLARFSQLLWHGRRLLRLRQRAGRAAHLPRLVPRPSPMSPSIGRQNVPRNGPMSFGLGFYVRHM